MVITRIDLARRLAPQLGVTHQHAERFLLAFMSEVSGALQRGDEVALRGFGWFRRPTGRSAPPGTPAPAACLCGAPVCVADACLRADTHRQATGRRRQVLVPPRTVARFKPYGVMTHLHPESED